MPHCLRNNLVCRDFFFPGGGDTSPGSSSFKILFFSFPGYKLYPFYYIWSTVPCIRGVSDTNDIVEKKVSDICMLVMCY